VVSKKSEQYTPEMDGFAAVDAVSHAEHLDEGAVRDQ
jgi:hypothetical protein|tara:strand:+ start:2368 stop:2478 length:111 start_codon:yes stop_codon:yes gene_type:complete